MRDLSWEEFEDNEDNELFGETKEDLSELLNEITNKAEKLE